MKANRLIPSVKAALLQAMLYALLGLYFAGSFPGESLHVLVHSKEAAELHSAEHEKDACHQTVFHGETKKGCAHKTHVSNADKCLFSQIAHQSPHLIHEVELNQPPDFNTAVIVFIDDTARQPLLDFSSARAPPIV